MSQLDDILRSRLVGQDTRHVTWISDWACERCKRYGGVTFQVTGGGLDVFNRPTTKETLEDILRKVFAAHRADDTRETACAMPLGKLTLGLAWRFVFEDGVRKQVFLPKKGPDGKGWLPETYSWPPWKVT